MVEIKLTDEIINFINDNLNKSASELLLRASKFSKDEMRFIAQQIVGKQLAKKKLPTWYTEDKILYPVRLSMEQCSSELTAKYKSRILFGGRGIDLTGGYGVDTYFLAQKSDSVVYCEKNEQLAKLVNNNFKAFKQDNCSVFIGDGLSYINQEENFDWIFIDPARRKQSMRTYKLEDCEPSILDIQDSLFEKSDRILIKTAPLLDIQQTLADLKFVKEVHILSVNNDCKEVLYYLDKNNSLAEPLIKCVNFKHDLAEDYNFNYSDELNTESQFSDPLTYLYEPNASIMKAGAFKSIAAKFGLYKLQQHSHLYTSEKLISDFPGRKFLVKELLAVDRKLINKYCSGKANLSCRNFPQNADSLRKKLKLKDGGENYLFATTLHSGELRVILCKKQ